MAGRNATARTYLYRAYASRQRGVSTPERHCGMPLRMSIPIKTVTLHKRNTHTISNNHSTSSQWAIALPNKNNQSTPVPCLQPQQSVVTSIFIVTSFWWIRLKHLTRRSTLLQTLRRGYKKFVARRASLVSETII